MPGRRQLLISGSKVRVLVRPPCFFSEAWPGAAGPFVCLPAPAATPAPASARAGGMPPGSGPHLALVGARGEGRHPARPARHARRGERRGRCRHRRWLPPPPPYVDNAIKGAGSPIARMVNCAIVLSRQGILAMLRTMMLVAALAAMVAAPAYAQTITDKKQCERALADAQEVRANSDAGAKANEEADKLLEVAAHLCGQGNFVYAQDVLEVIRGILATE